MRLRQACVGVRLALAEEPRLDDGPLLVALATHHVARVLRTASTQQALDAATYAFQVRQLGWPGSTQPKALHLSRFQQSLRGVQRPARLPCTTSSALSALISAQGCVDCKQIEQQRVCTHTAAWLRAGAAG